MTGLVTVLRHAVRQTLEPNPRGHRLRDSRAVILRRGRVLGHTLSASERAISRWESGREGSPSLPAQRVLAAVREALGFAPPPVLAAAADVDALAHAEAAQRSTTPPASPYSWPRSRRAAAKSSERADGSIRLPMRRSEALLTLGVVAAHPGELDASVDYGLAGLGDARKSAPSLLCTAADLDATLDEHRAEPIAALWREARVAVRASLTNAGGPRRSVRQVIDRRDDGAASRQAGIAGSMAEVPRSGDLDVRGPDGANSPREVLRSAVLPAGQHCAERG